MAVVQALAMGAIRAAVVAGFALAFARALVAEAVARAVRRAGSHLAECATRSRLAHTLAEQAGAATVAILRTGWRHVARLAEPAA